MALLLGDLPGIQQVELDASGDVGDAGLAGFARGEVAGLNQATLTETHYEL